VKLRNIYYVAFIATIFSGCSSYHPMPLLSDRSTVQQISLENAEIKVKAKEIKHPILKPIDFNDKNGLSPDEAAILAVIINPELKAVRDKRQIASAQLLQAGLLPNPQLSYDMEFPTGGETTGTTTAFGLGLNWDISSLISHEAKIDASSNNVKSVSLDIAWKEWQVAEAAKLNVYRIEIADKQVAIAKKALAQQKENRKLIFKGVTLGEKTSIQMSATDTAVKQAELEVLTAQQQLQKERLGLNQTLGLSPDKKISLQKKIAIPYFENLPYKEKLLEGIENRRLDLLALKAGYESQEAKVRAAIKSQFPRISIGPSAGRDIENVETAGFGLNIELPFFDRNQGNIAIERATRKQLFDEYHARLSDAKFEITRILVEIYTTRKQINAVEQYLPELNKLAQSYKKAAEQGSSDYISYYQALNDLYSRQIELQQLQRKLVDLGIALEISSGCYLPTQKADTGHQRKPK
jgi:outer membrane protein TolC